MSRQFYIPLSRKHPSSLYNLEIISFRGQITWNKIQENDIQNDNADPLFQREEEENYGSTNSF